MTPRIALATAFAALFLISCSPKGLIAADEGSPESVVKTATDAMNQGRNEEFAKAMHPEALKKFRETMMTVIEEAGKEGKADEVLKLFPTVKDIAGLKKLDDSKFFADYMGGVMKMQPALKQALAQAKVEAVGHIAEGKDVAHVVYWMKLEGNDKGAKVLVASLGKDGPKWKMQLAGDIEMMTLMMKQKAQGKMDFPDFKKTEIQVLGHLADKDEAEQVVYRTITPFAETKLKKVNVLTISKDDPAWKAVKGGDSAATTKLLKEKLGL